MSETIAIDAELVERLLHELARYGAWGDTGVVRKVYTPEWVGAQQQVMRWAEESGLHARQDAVGNVWARLEGLEGGPSIVTGSHIDSQAPGGRFDGALGVIAGLVALRTLRERFGTPRRTLELVSFCEEESSRFPATNFWGSRAVTGLIGPDEPETLRDYDGVTIADAMRAVGLDPRRIPEAKRDDIDVFIELHVEQGPILEQQGLPVAVVTGFPGIRHYLVEVRGRADHAGAMPMDLRQDPMPAAAEMISAVIARAREIGRPAVTTVGRVLVEPNFPAIVPEKVSFTIDVRHPDPAALSELCAAHEETLRSIAQRHGREVSWRITTSHPPCSSDPELVQLFLDAAAEQEIPVTTMPSGAVHDAQRMAHIARVAMVFVRSVGGRSHTPAEFTTTEDAVAGIQVLTAGLHRVAY
ncbi:Zn-dependent hydrolase [Thermomicrobiaceae bacterium CFH 74404]|uniref:Zn-dependent hydrolase n=1 Tax=Thermalbibacter longus TaxID=2951981 RepID=A0AA42BDP9_9BACT|nr:Zn-dependent hydrolase [Thermalbibacter longus]MCM8749958.1 Zn-dependent hydrolase [Thermalbibacter longus]